MRGEVLHYDEDQGVGLLTGADGELYTFRREDLRREASLSKGTLVEFAPHSSQAAGIFVIRAGTGVPAITRANPAAPQLGRNTTATPAAQPSDTGLWSYFRRSLTTNYASFRGRARRKEYWGYFLFWMLAAVAIGAAGLLIDTALGNLDGGRAPFVTIAASTLWVLGTIIPGLAVTIRRQHDIGLSGWFYLLVLIPSIGGLIIFVFTLIPSQKHENRWGSVPEGVPIPQPFVAVGA